MFVFGERAKDQRSSSLREHFCINYSPNYCLDYSPDYSQNYCPDYTLGYSQHPSPDYKLHCISMEQKSIYMQMSTDKEGDSKSTKIVLTMIYKRLNGNTFCILYLIKFIPHNL
ncbi:hypothetical protein FF38_06705 [Lucilia cuprina]|uniref:Uncharacterized protein n=1 Tax=Lucilia cuprina TaxID=7375 RepID=A0A0L0C1P8_LUCCU|nr:hypothetical protein FF38_06705 [Lucilia cuprina]